MQIEMNNEETFLKKQVKIFKALTSPYRIKILNILREGEHRVCDIERHGGIPQAYCSQELAVLRKAGLVQGRREGRYKLYHVMDARIFELLDIVEEIAGK